MKIPHTIDGFTLVESLIATIIITLTIGLGFRIFGGQILDVSKSYEVLDLTQKCIQYMDSSIDNKLFYFEEIDYKGVHFLRNVEVYDGNNDLLKVTITVKDEMKETTLTRIAAIYDES